MRVPFELPVASTEVAEVSLKSHEPSPLAWPFVQRSQALVQSLPAPARLARQRACIPDAEPRGALPATTNR